jgi:hypothetical protein
MDEYGKKLAFLRNFCYFWNAYGERMGVAFPIPAPVRKREQTRIFPLISNGVRDSAGWRKHMKLYKPVHHKPAHGRGFEGAESWSSTPWNSPYEQSYLSMEQFPGQRFWTWGMFATLEGVSEELLQELHTEGWEPWNEKTKPFFQILESHFAQTLIVNEYDYGFRYWAQATSIAFAQQHPVLLTYQTGEEDYPHLIPPNMVVGTCALIPENERYCLLTLDQLGEQGRELSKRIQAGMLLFSADTDPYELERRARAQERLAAWEATHTAAEQLAMLYWGVYQKQQQTKAPGRPLPALNSAHRTRLPLTNSFRGLAQSFGPAVQPSLFNEQRQEAGTLELLTPNGSLLQVVGTNTAENVALHRYVTRMLGPEGLKHLIILLEAYYLQTQAAGQKVDARVSLRQLLIRMGAGTRADDREEQRKVMHSILYLASTYITSDERPPEQEMKPLPLARQKRRRKQDRKIYSPLLVIERLKPGSDGSIQIPDEVDYHLGSEFFDALFGTQQQFFSLPTALLLGFHAIREQQELLLAFYLCNALITAGGQFFTTFSTLLLQSALQSQEDLSHGHDRLRDTQRVLLALERLEQQGIVRREAHPAVDKALTMGLATGKFKQEELAPSTLQRIEQEVAYSRHLSAETLRTGRRVAFQQLLDEHVQDLISFLAGPLLADQVSEHARQRKIQEQKASSPSTPVEVQKPRRRRKKGQDDH